MRAAAAAIIAESPNGRRAHEVSVASVREALAEQGLYVVTAAEKAVLDAMAACEHDRMLVWSEATTVFHGLRDAAKAELARREAAK